MESLAAADWAILRSSALGHLEHADRHVRVERHDVADPGHPGGHRIGRRRAAGPDKGEVRGGGPPDGLAHRARTSEMIEWNH